MIITCPSCSSKFAVKAEAIGLTGRKVRCAKCKHDWFQDPSQEMIEAAKAIMPEPSSIDPIPAGGNLPAPIPAESAPLYIKFAFACSILLLLFTISLMASNKILPHAAWYYSALGIQDDSGIALYNISAEKASEDKKNELLIKGRIVNESSIDKSIPNVRITLLGEGREKVRSITLDSKNTVLAPGQGVDFENRVKELPDNVSTIVMDIGNRINLASR